MLKDQTYQDESFAALAKEENKKGRVVPRKANPFAIKGDCQEETAKSDLTFSLISERLFYFVWQEPPSPYVGEWYELVKSTSYSNSFINICQDLNFIRRVFLFANRLIFA